MIFVGYTRCWQLKYFLNFDPETWGFMMIQFDGPHIFQMGWWKNHQLDYLLSMVYLPTFTIW